MPPALPRTSYAAQVHRAERCGGERLDHEVAVRHGIETVRRRPVEPEVRRQGRAVDRVRGAGERRRPERATPGAPTRVREPFAVAIEHLEVGETPVREEDRLRPLKVRIARHHRVDLALGELHEGGPDGVDLAAARRDLVADPEPQIGRDLVVATPARMQLLAEVADTLDQTLLDPRVHVLGAGIAHGGGIGGGDVRDRGQRDVDRPALVRVEHAGANERLRPRPRPGDVARHQPVIDRKRVVERLEQRVRVAFEAPAPHAHAVTSPLPAAAMRLGRVYSRMNPAASFWS
jgi:hypothetical protein